MSLVPPRSHAPELMDRSDNPREALAAALRDLRLVNRWLGGRRVLSEAIRPLLLAHPPQRPLRLLDVGTGDADLPLALLELAQGLGRSLEVTAVDRDPQTVALAAQAVRGRGAIHVVQADARRLPFAPGAFDLVTASLFLHHFRQHEVVELLAAFRRLARRAVLVNDLRRHRVPWLFIGLAGRATRRSAMFVHDGPLSVLRGFTAGELLEAARGAGARGARVERRWPYRL
ncbi:MAG TPA: methyltransferase domain-containing protein, partial [Candidatus Polarisedimenticolaceae bacterium]|nr:methyltransferase domain-containing protein [Candidatus Polarisedimenticolaceae bacterium]